MTDEDESRTLSTDLPTARREATLHKRHGVEPKDDSDREKNQSRRDYSLVFTILGLLASAIFAVFALAEEETAVALTAIAFVPPFLFASFERYVKTLELEKNSTDKYYPNLDIWVYGMVLGVKLVVLYLFVRVFLSSIGRYSTNTFVSPPNLWHNVIILSFLSIALCIVTYALVSVSRSEI